MSGQVQGLIEERPPRPTRSQKIKASLGFSKSAAVVKAHQTYKNKALNQREKARLNQVAYPIPANLETKPYMDLNASIKEPLNLQIRSLRTSLSKNPLPPGFSKENVKSYFNMLNSLDPEVAKASLMTVSLLADKFPQILQRKQLAFSRVYVYAYTPGADVTPVNAALADMNELRTELLEPPYNLTERHPAITKHIDVIIEKAIQQGAGRLAQRGGKKRRYTQRK